MEERARGWNCSMPHGSVPPPEPKGAPEHDIAPLSVPKPSLGFFEDTIPLRKEGKVATEQDENPSPSWASRKSNSAQADKGGCPFRPRPRSHPGPGSYPASLSAESSRSDGPDIRRRDCFLQRGPPGLLDNFPRPSFSA